VLDLKGRANPAILAVRRSSTSPTLPVCLLLRCNRKATQVDFSASDISAGTLCRVTLTCSSYPDLADVPPWALRQQANADHNEDRYRRRSERAAQGQSTMVDRLVEKIADRGS
jgi:hypothetical protein